jgi:hypothetical protein
MPWALINLLIIKSRHTWISGQKFVQYLTYTVRKNCRVFEGNLLLYLYYKQKDKQTRIYQDILLLPSAHRILSNRLLSNLVPYVEGIFVFI